MDRTPPPIRVLHVDDEPGVTDLVATHLERNDDRIEVQTTNDPEAALEMLGSTEIDCVVSDYHMPGLSGLEVLQAVRAEWPNLPFILYTGKGSEEIASEAISNGVTDYLQKGTGTDQYALLANRIHNAVSQYRIERQATKQGRILQLLQDVNQALVQGTTRDEIERSVTSIFADADGYGLAWMGEHDADDNRIVPRTVAPVDADAVASTALMDPPEEGVVTQALRTEDIAVTRQRAHALAVGADGEPPVEYAAAAVVPIIYHGERHGVLALYADHPDQFGDDERAVLEEIGGDVAQALHGVETSRTLGHHQTVVEAVPDGVFILDEEGRIVMANEPSATLIDRSTHAVEGEHFSTLVEAGIFDEDVIDWYLDSVREMLSSTSDREESRYEVEIQPPEGGLRVVEIHLTLRPFDETFRGTVGVVHDITDRKRRERRLQEQSGKIKALHDVATDIETCDTTAAVYERVVTAAESILDFDIAVADEAQGDVLVSQAVSADLSADQYYDETPVDAENNLAAEAYRSGEPSVVDDLSQHDVAPADPVFRSALSVPVGDQGVFQAVTETASAFDARDCEAAELLVAHARSRLTQLAREQRLREQTTQLQRQNERLDKFASVVSHDLRNPLNVADGRLTAAREAYDSEDLDEVDWALDRMNDLIEGILTLAREGSSVSDREPVEVDEFFEECWTGVDAPTGTLSIDSDQRILADPSRLRRLVENLFRNEIEHGGPDVTITVGALDDGFYVADDGPGVPEDRREDVFEWGYSTAEGGTGFGLSIVREIAEAHGWTVRMTESEAGGARLAFTAIDILEGQSP